MCRVSGSFETGFSAMGEPMESISSCWLAISGVTSGGGLRGLALQRAQAGDLLLRGLVAGIDLGGVQKLGHGALQVAGHDQLAALGQVQARGRNAHPVQSASRIAQILGSFGGGLLVVVKGGVVVLALLRRPRRACRSLLADSACSEDARQAQKSHDEEERKENTENADLGIAAERTRFIELPGVSELAQVSELVAGCLGCPGRDVLWRFCSTYEASF